ncbi:MAG: metal ABC transporter solute-binding protein, Zn/Mn family [Syntrophobacteraceae bacterium]
MKGHLWVILVVVLVCVSISAAFAQPADERKVIKAVVSIVPQKYFVDKIGGSLVDVSVMIQPGMAAERYEPKPKQMVALNESKVYFAIGVPFEDVWLEKITAANRKLLVVHTEVGIEKRWMEDHHHEGDSHVQKAGEAESSRHISSHGVKDPHIWLSPPLVALQARNILDGLLTIDPSHSDVYEANYKNFIVELVDLDLAIRKVFRPKGLGLKFMVFHPTWGYFAEAYGLQQIPVEIEGKEPKAQDLQRLIKLAEETNIKVVFVQPQFSDRSAQTVADAIGGRTLPADGLAQDWAKNLLDVAQLIAKQ